MIKVISNGTVQELRTPEAAIQSLAAQLKRVGRRTQEAYNLYKRITWGYEEVLGTKKYYKE